jgi:hypothetical protein
VGLFLFPDHHTGIEHRLENNIEIYLKEIEPAASFKILTEVTFQIEVLWVVTL